MLSICNYQSDRPQMIYIFLKLAFSIFITLHFLSHANWSFVHVLPVACWYLLSQTMWAAIVSYHRLGGLQAADIYFSQFWKLGSPRSRCQQIYCLVRSCFLVVDTLFSLCSDIAEGQESSLGSLIKAEPSWPNRCPKAPPPKTNTLGIRFCHMNLRGGAQAFSL